MIWKLTIESCAETQFEAVVKARQVLEKMLESQHGYTVGTAHGSASGEWEPLEVTVPAEECLPPRSQS